MNPSTLLLSRKASLIILGVTALIFSRAFFALIDDPEGPNLLIVAVMAAILFLLSFPVYASKLRSSAQGRFSLALLAQAAIVTVSYLLLR